MATKLLYLLSLIIEFFMLLLVVFVLLFLFYVLVAMAASCCGFIFLFEEFTLLNLGCFSGAYGWTGFSG